MSIENIMRDQIAEIEIEMSKNRKLFLEHKIDAQTYEELQHPYYDTFREFGCIMLDSKK